MFAKSEVNGANTNEVYRYLRRNSELHDRSKNRSKVIPWNFTKFICATQFVQNDYLSPREKPEVIKQKIEAILARSN